MSFFLRAVICETGCARRFPLRGRATLPRGRGCCASRGVPCGAGRLGCVGYGVRGPAAGSSSALGMGFCSCVCLACRGSRSCGGRGFSVVGAGRAPGWSAAVAGCCQMSPFLCGCGGAWAQQSRVRGGALGRRPVVRCGCGVREGAGQGWNGPISVREFRCPVRGWSDRVRFGTVGPNRRTSYFQPA